MCGLFASSSKKTFIELAKRNQHRGSTTHSYTEFFGDGCQTFRKEGSFDENQFLTDLKDDQKFIIGHVQAPTNTSSLSHPAESADNLLLWHNGIIKEHCIESMQNRLGIVSSWDTELLAEWLDKCYSLSEIEGSFACFMYADGDVYVFRNAISPLFVDDLGNFSSVKIDKSFYPLQEDRIWQLNLNTKHIEPVVKFKTLNNPYYFGV